MLLIKTRRVPGTNTHIARAQDPNHHTSSGTTSQSSHFLSAVTFQDREEGREQQTGINYTPGRYSSL